MEQFQGAPMIEMDINWAEVFYVCPSCKWQINRRELSNLALSVVDGWLIGDDNCPECEQALRLNVAPLTHPANVISSGA